MSNHYVFTFDDRCDELAQIIIAGVKDGFDSIDGYLESDWYKKQIDRIVARYDASYDIADEKVRDFLKATQWLDSSDEE